MSPRYPEPFYDIYVRRNLATLQEFEHRGQDPDHGVDKRILRALHRRGLVWWGENYTGGLTEQGRRAVDALENIPWESS